MKTYHIVYFPTAECRVSTGVNIESESMIEALASFVRDYDLDPFSIVLKTESLYEKKN